jgi:hypothetical protein
MAARKSLDLLPIIFQTDANKKFLSATLDQLISEPVLKTVNGYIGRTFAPTYKNKDSYVIENTVDRQNYQLEPSIVIRNDNKDITFFSSYIDLLNKINYYGGLTNNHSRLFDSQYYSFDPKISFDKFVNFSQYYWLPNGPDSIDVNTAGVELENTYEVTRSVSTKRYEFSTVGKTNNTITLARGGVYKFVVDQPGVPFWIQSELGVDGLVNATPTISTRDVLGVTNNGADTGTITFAVPPVDAQDRFTKMLTVANVDYAAPLPYSRLHNRLLSDFLAEYPQYAGITGQLDGKTLIFVDEAIVQESLGESAWTSGIVYDDDGNAVLGYGEGEVVPDTKRYGIWKVIYVDIGQDTPLVRLENIADVNYDEKVYIKTGIGNANKEFYKEFTGFFVRAPHITSVQDTLYIQDGTDSSIYAFIKLVDPIDWSIDVERDILGQQEYTSPNGIEFTSGLKIKFGSDVTPEAYQNKTYYVENVGDVIRLVDIELLVTPESYNEEIAINYPLKRVVMSSETIAPIPAGTTISVGGVDIITDTDVPIGRSYITTLDSIATIALGASVTGTGIADGTTVISVRSNTVFPEYVSIKRDAYDLNAWSRNNRWFHRDIITKTAEYNNTTITFDQDLRAQRPIVQFESDLQLFNYGRIGKRYIDILDTTTLNAFNELEGKVLTRAFGVELYDGLRVLFAADEDPLVRDKIYIINLVQYDYDEETLTPVGDVHIKLTIADDGEGEVYDSIVVTSGQYKGSQWWYDGATWFESQQKTQLQQDPLFDVYDSTGVSLSTYARSTFAGTKIFGYNKTSTGITDTVLGFPLKYRSFQTQGDIEFQNYFDTDTFNYVIGQQVIDVKVATGFLHAIVDRYTVEPRNNWRTVAENSKQYQLITFIYDGSNNPFAVDITPAVDTGVPNVKVYQNSTYLSTNKWTLVDNNLTLLTPLVDGDKIDVRIYSNEVSELGFYEVPTNLNLNAQNKDLDSLTLGQLRNHLVELSQNSTSLIGNVLGANNLRDIEIKQQGGSILQHSAPVPYSSIFLLDETANFINALRLAQAEYARFKNKFLELSVGLPGVSPTDPVSGVDLILSNINAIKNKTFPWFYSDMVPYGTLKSVVSGPNGYTIFDPLVHSYEISKVFNDKELGNTSVIVYLTKSGSTTKLQLLKDIHYVFRTDRPAIELLLEDFATYSEFVNDRTTTIEVGDLLTIVEYANTDGNYIPETPTKLGLYPKFTPEIFEDDTYRVSINVIRGHDGSLTPAFGDYRDDFLLELEKRIYNNIKLPDTGSYQEVFSVIPGKFRNNDYSINEITQILTKNFMSWVGNNKLDFSSNNTFENNDPFTWNYATFVDTVGGERLPGSWRACYRYFYDTTRPHQTPWEMLGFSIKPSWWEDFYGPAPYTGGNTLLWEDLEAGIIRQGERSNGQHYTEWASNTEYLQGDYVRYEGTFYLAPNNNPSRAVFDASEWLIVDQSVVPWIPNIDIKFARPGLSTVIPVDQNGFLKNPAELMVKSFNASRAGTAWAVGAIGPVENAWRNSSDYPFAIQQTLALAKPARYFGILIDTYRHVLNSSLDQYLTINNDHVNQNEIYINGDTSGNTVIRSAGYLNWIAEYLRNQGINPSAKITPLIKNYEVNLAYKMAGFSDNKYIQVLAEQSSPSSTNDSIIIPNENYNIHLYKSTPVNKLVYSAVIVEKTNSGYSIRGYNLNDPYFTIIPSVVNSNAYNITIQNSKVAIYRDYQQLKLTIPYGYEFISQQQVADFLISYERYLLSQGFQFDDTDDILGQTRNWRLSVKEFLFWAQQGWREGSILVLSPVSETINGISIQSITDGITDSQYGSKVLDQNFRLVKNNNYSVMRTPNSFKVSLTDTASVIGYVELDLVQYEHVLIFDNATVFNDIIYKPELGNRQYRLKLVGQQTDLWDGSLSAPGFIYNSGVVQTWLAGKDYLKGDLIQYKNQYYVALQPVIASNEFQFAFWKQIGVDEIKKGLLPNFSSIAVQSQSYYDSYGYFNAADQVKYSHGLIGFKPRQYLDDLGMNETTQIELYKGFIKQKGSLNAINQLTSAEFNNLNSAINLYEEWAIRVGEYGALDINPYLEIILDEKEFSVNPATARFVSGTNVNEGDGLTVFNKSQLYKSTDQYDGTIALNRDDTSDVDNDIPTAGYVNIDDVDATIFDLTNYSDLDSDLTNIGTGYTIWTAKDFSQNWNVYRVTETNNSVILLENILDSFVTFTMASPHGLTLGEVFLIRQFDPSFDGFYQVTRISANNKITVRYTGPSTNLDALTSLQGNGIFFVLDSLRFQFMEDARLYTPPNGWRVGEKIWIDVDAETTPTQGQPYSPTNTWKVYEKTQAWEYTQNITKSSNEYIANDGFGTSIKMSTDTQLIISGTPQQGVITLQIGAGITANAGSYLTQVSTGANLAILQTVINSKIITGAYVNENSFNYVGNLFVDGVDSSARLVSSEQLYGRVETFNRTVNDTYQQGTTLIPTADNTLEFGMQVDIARSVIAVGAPGSYNNVGYVYIYNRAEGTTNIERTQILTGNILASNERFGQSFAFDEAGTWLYVGAPGTDTVYVYGLNTHITEEQEIVPIRNENTIRLTGNLSVAEGDFITQPATGANIVILSNSTASNVSVASLTNIVIESDLANVQISQSITATAGSYLTQLSSGANVTLSQNIVNSTEIIGRRNNSTPFDLSGNLYLDDELITVTVDSEVYTVVPTADGSGNIFLNNVDTGLYPSILYSIATANTITLNFTPAVTDDATSLLVTSGLKLYIPNIDYTVANTTITFSTVLAEGEITIVQQPYYVLTTTINGPDGSEFGYAVDSSYDGAQLAVGTPNDTVNVGVFTTALGSTIERSIPVGVLSANIIVDGSVAALTSYREYPGAGSVYVYDRVIEAYNSVVDSVPGTNSQEYQTNGNIGTVYRVTIDGIVTEDYSKDPAILATNTIKFDRPTEIGRVIYIETNAFNLLEKLIGIDSLEGGLNAIQTGARFGTSLTICSNNCAIYVGAPYYDNGTTYNTGAVWKFHNKGRLYGVNTGQTKNPLFTPGDTIRLDNFEVTITGTTLDEVIEDINNANILGVSAVNFNGFLRLDSDKTVAKNLLRILSGSGTVFEDAGMAVFAFMQIIVNPYDTPGENFGTKVILASNAYMLLISSETGTTRERVTFDTDQTIFDDESTVFFNDIKGSGSVYTYELYDDPRDEVENPGRYAFAQQLNVKNSLKPTDAGYDPEEGLNVNDRFGYAIDIIDTTHIIVSSPGDDVYGLNSGSIYLFKNPNRVRGWNLIRYQEPKVDIESIDRVYLYNNLSNSILTNLEYIDPAKGKILGQAEQEITYKTPFDPAVYNRGTASNLNENLYWSSSQVGKIWWNLSQVRFIDYEQGSLTYRSINWGRLFPGSVIEVAEWVESNSLPSFYDSTGGAGTPLFPDNSSYVEITYVDPITNIVSSKYYFWVTDKTTVDANNPSRTLPVSAIQDLIANPKNQDIAYAAFIRDDAFVIFNAGEYLSAKNTILHLDYEIVKNDNIIHSEYELIQKGNPVNYVPAKIVNKLIDSLAGVDSQGAVVPDPTLSVADRYGISTRPRQSLFNNRLTAMSNLISYVNSVLIKKPVARQYELTQLAAEEAFPTSKASGSIVGEYDARITTEVELNYIDVTELPTGYRILVETDTSQDNLWVIYELLSDKTWQVAKVQSYKTSLYWDYIDWYAEGYGPSEIIEFVVDTLVDALKLPAAPGDEILVRVADGGNGKWNLITVLDTGEFRVVGIQDGTLQLKTSIADYDEGSLGFGNQGFESNRFDQNPNIEIRYIIQALRDDIFVNELQGEFNNLFFVMVNYLFNEQKYVDWIFKTSFVSVTHQLRALDQYPNYIKDNQTYYQDYINEVKPYVTKIREYLIGYTGNDEFAGSITDFDLPPYYDAAMGVFRSPSGEESVKDQQLWATGFSGDTLVNLQYPQWYGVRNNQITRIDVETPGSGYTSVPVVTIVGGGNGVVPATARAVIDFDLGTVTAIELLTPGSGYETTPTVVINGSSDVPATAYAILKNNFVRSFDTTLKFDRISYRSTVSNWQPATTVLQGNIVSNNGTAYRALEDVYSSAIMVLNANISVTVGDVVGQVGYVNDSYTTTANVLYSEPDSSVIVVGNIIGQFDTLTSNLTINGVDANVAITNYTHLFDSTKYEVIPAGDFDNANDRIMGYYNPTNSMPAKDLNQLIYGIDYPGVQVTGLSFDITPGFDGKLDSSKFDMIDYDEDGNPILSTDAVDTTIRSFYTDSNLGLRPEDIDIDGGSYVDRYSSHAPEELVPGRVFDTLDMKVYTSVTVSPNVSAVLGYRMFVNMFEDTSFLRIADAYSTTLAQELLYDDTEIVVADASVLPTPNPGAAIPGVVFIGSERITYYTIDLSTNTLGQLRRGTQGTTSPARYNTGVSVVDGSLNQIIPGVSLGNVVLDSANTYAVTDTVTYRLLLSNTISANIGDVVTQVTSGANVTVAGINSASTNTLLIKYNNSQEFDFSNVASANLAINGLNTGNIYPISSNIAGYNLSENGTVLIDEQHLVSGTTGKLSAKLFGDIIGNILTTSNINQWYNIGSNFTLSTDGTGFEGAATSAVMFLKSSPATNTLAATIPDILSTEDTVNTLITEDGNQILEE